ncbi:MAG: hypothetical protein KF819_03785 [Labilithrix sp.]|nr:hypothetical protein [Labilithrix sp.]
MRWVVAFGLAVGATACSLFVDLSALRADPESAPPDASTADAPDAPDAPEIGVGSGKTGPLEVKSDGAVINAYAVVTANVQIGDRHLVVDDVTGFTSGDVVLVWQATGATGVVSGQATTTIGPTASVGRYELARVSSVEPARVAVDRAMISAYAAPGTQIVRVPELSELVVRSGGRLTAAPWDGARGGILAALVAGPILVEGTISTDGAGFRGGAAFAPDDQTGGCPDLDGPPMLGYAQKGQGIATLPDASLAGRGNIANGGGGGNCDDAGGGGGGGAGRGGRGGKDYSSLDVGGMGGAPLDAPARERLFMGGGGGAGSADFNTHGIASGGSGGGIVFLRGRLLDLRGQISADGANGEGTPSILNGAGGGGGGGTVYVQVEQSPTCAGRLGARGGNGGHCESRHGPGGGGGGGRIRLESAAPACAREVGGGAPGLSGTDPRGATGGEIGIGEL